MPTRALATVMYEDQRVSGKPFSMHDFIMRCAYDASNVPDEMLYKIEGRIDGRAMKGNSKLLQAMHRDVHHIAADGRAVFAIFDNDRVRELLDLPKNATEEQVESAIRAKCPGQRETVHITLLRENTESILEAAKECDVDARHDQTTFDRALRKEPAARDVIFTNLSKVAERTIRDCILGKLPSLRSLIERIADLIRPLHLSEAGSQE